jgi:hypothetical protein
MVLVLGRVRLVLVMVLRRLQLLLLLVVLELEPLVELGLEQLRLLLTFLGKLLVLLDICLILNLVSPLERLV